MSFSQFLEAKPLYYDTIDHQRIHDAYRVLYPYIKEPKKVHIVGTNGKGSIGRIVAHLAHTSGLSVGHFSSPHILKFNERIWIDGEDSSDDMLELAHQKLYRVLGKERSDALSYFEYTTLLALVVFEDVDLVVLEAGLGGEFDATNICDKELTIITPIGIDHQAFLGATIEEIASTKIRSIQKQALLAPQIYQEVDKVAKEIALEKKAILHTLSISAQTEAKLKEIAKHNKWGEYLVQNASTALYALDILAIDYTIETLKELELFGRFYPFRENIRIDVGHNPLAAKAILQALERPIVLIYNSLDDKEYEEVLRVLKPKIKRVELIAISSQRAVTLSSIEEALKKVELEYTFFNNNIDPKEEYLVFGSFYVVEEFLRKIT